MARIASQAKMGYYSTPPVVVEHVKSALTRSNPGPFRFLDTCCGEGEALNLLAAGFGPEVETYGVELDETRLKKSAQKLHHVVWGDALTELRITIKAFSLLWLNPPYDWDGDGSRLETRFLETHLKYLAPRGWLIFIIPHRALKSVKETLAKLNRLHIFAFPQAEYDAFKQLVVLGQKSPTLQGGAQLEHLTEISNLAPLEAWERLSKTSEIMPGSIMVFPSPEGWFIFTSERLELEKAAALVAKSPLWKEWDAISAPQALHRIRPLAPLRQGHTAMLLAAWLMNGEVTSKSRRLVIKGSVQKKVELERETTYIHLIEKRTESFKIVIRAIDLDTREIFAIS